MRMLPQAGALALAPLVLCTTGAGGQAINSVGAGPAAPPSKKWRVLNKKAVTYGWQIGELRFFRDSACSQEITSKNATATSQNWKPISSGFRDFAADRGFDKLTWTQWRAQCYMCDIDEAWLGIELEQAAPCQCVQLWQWGNRDYKSTVVHVQRWDDTTDAWQTILAASSLDGDRWDRLFFTKCKPLQAPDYGRIKLTNGGFYPSSGKFSCVAARILVGSSDVECLSDGSWTGSAPRCWALLEFAMIASSIFAFEVCAFALYYWRVVSRKAPALTATTFISEENLGRWTCEMSDTWNVREDPDKTLLYVIFCSCCRLAQTWQAVGMIPYYVGVWIPQVLCLCMPCVGAAFRCSMRGRFSIKAPRFADITAWFCCAPCAAAQEARHADEMCEVAEDELQMRQRLEKQKEEKEKQMMANKGDRPDLGPVKIKIGKAEGEGRQTEQKRSSSIRGYKKAKSVLEYGPTL